MAYTRYFLSLSETVFSLGELHWPVSEVGRNAGEIPCFKVFWTFCFFTLGANCPKFAQPMKSNTSNFCIHFLKQFSFLLLVFACFDATSQRYNNPKSGYEEQYVDSVSIYLDSAQIIATKTPLRAVNYINRAIEISIHRGDYNAESKAYLALGNLQKSMGQPAMAVENFKKCIQAKSASQNSSGYSKKIERGVPILNDVVLFEAYSQSAASLETLGRNDEALKSINVALGDQFSGVDDQRRKNATRTLAAIRINLGNTNEALSLLNGLLSDDRNAKNASGEAQTLLALGSLYEGLSNDIKAVEYYNQAKSVSDKYGMTALSIESNEALAAFYRSRGDFTQEIQARNSNIVINQKANNSYAVKKENLEIGNAYLNSDNAVMAESYLKKSLDVQLNVDDNKSLVNSSDVAQQLAPIPYRSAELQVGADAYKQLAQSYLKRNELTKALDYYQRYAQQQDSVQAARNLELSEAIELSNSIGQNQQRIQLLEKERELTDKSIEVLRQDRELKNEQVFNRNIIIFGLGICMAFMLVTAFYMIRNNRARRKADKILTLQSLSGQMNPHFIFNALNSVNEYISQNDERAANRYLSSFSKLMRQVMDDSRHTFIPLEEEIEMLKLYLQLEHSRFKDKFNYELNIAEELQNAGFELPPMIVQPYLENAIWHGLRYREGMGSLHISFKMEGEQLMITIIDDGIGLQKSKEIKTLNQKKQVSLGMQNIRTRLELMNEIYSSGMSISVSESFPGAENVGATVKICIPQNISKTAVA